MTQQHGFDRGGRFRTVALGNLVTDGKFNRGVSDSWVTHIANAFDPAKFEPIIVAANADGTFTIIEGQHRVAAARMIGVPETAKCIPAIVHDVEDVQERAALFLASSDKLMVAQYPKFVAQLTSGLRSVLHINQIVKSAGLEVAAAAGDGHVAAIAALRVIYGLGEPEGAVLALTLATLRTAWGDTAQAYNAKVLRGVGLYIHGHRDTEPAVLGRALVQGPGEPFGLIGWGKALSGNNRRMTLDRAIAEVIEKRVMRPKRRAKAVG